MACPHCGSPHPKEAKLCPVTGLAIAARRPGGLAPGDLLDGKYQITCEVGRGAMGVVYEAMHTALGRRVAVKTLLEELSANPQLGERFEREARAASAIGHPHIIDVFDLGRTQDGLLFMVMELLDGASLGAILKETPRLPIPLATHLMVQVLSGLSAAHKHGIVHRDLKPDNIFVLNSEERPSFVKIVDFGISKVLIAQGPGLAVTAKGSGTLVGSILGTPLYMSPEQAIGHVASIDHRADIYSAGVVLYEMLCGRTPYIGEGYAQILGSLLEGKYPSPRSLRPEISPALEGAIMRALERNIENRFPSAAAMRDAISGGSAEVTPSPVMVSASVGDPLRISLADVAGQPAQGSASIVLLEAPAPAVLSERHRASSSADPFAPPPDREASPLLADDLDRPLALGSSPGRRPSSEPRVEPREIAVEEPARTRPAAQSKKTMAPERLLSARTRSRLVMALLLLALAVGTRLTYSYLRPAGDDRPALRRGVACKVHLTVEPSQASVQIDHVPTTLRELSLDSGAPHVLNATSPGRVTRRFAFDAMPGLELSLHLRHNLPLPSPTDPPPLSTELAVDYPDDARAQAEIEHAFAKLDRYADCLAMAGDVSAEGRADSKKRGGRGRMRGEELALCQRLVSEAGSAEPAMSELQTAAETYLGAGGQKLEAIGRMATTLRAEFLAARAAWQFEELSRQGKDDGQKAAWHMRRVALAAQAWLRSHKAQAQGAQEVGARSAKLREYQQALLDYAQGAGPEIARITGASDFMQAADNVVALALGKKPSEFAALDAVRRVLSAFNALVVE
ncbi:MAG TPA: protein kinase [Polyangia bacterium]